MQIFERCRFGLGLFLLILILTACGGGQTPPAAQGTPPALGVLITDINCPSVEVESGMQVAWTNKGGQVYVVQSAPGPDGSRYFDSGELQPGDSFVFTFTGPGIYLYQCTPDGEMTGTVTIKP
jgi:hypothetical protein